MLITEHKRPLAVGLEWSMAPNEKELRAESRRKPKAHRVIGRRPGQLWLGLYEEPYKGAAYAGALIVGMVEPKAIVCEPVNEEQSWVCAISDGMPLVGHDQLVPTANARRTVMDWMTRFPNSALIGTGVHGRKFTLQEVLEAFERSVEGKQTTAKQLAAAKLEAQSMPWLAVVKIVGACLLPVAAYFGWQHWEQSSLARRDQKVSVARLANEVVNAEKLAAQRKLLTDNFHRSIADKRAELTSVSDTDSMMAWQEWERVRKSIPLTSRGYVPQRLECDLKVCQLGWAGAGPFTRPSDKLDLPGVVADLEPTLTAKSEFVLPAEKLNARKTQGRTVTGAAELRFAIVSNLMGFPNLIVEPAQAAIVTPAPDLGLKPITVGAMGTWRLSFNDRFALLQAREWQQRIASWPMKATKVRYSGLGQVPSSDSSQSSAASQSVVVEVEGVYGFVQPKEGAN